MRALLLCGAILVIGASSSAAQEPCPGGPEGCVSFPGPVGIGTSAPTQKLEVFDGFFQVTRPLGSTDSAVVWLRQANVPANRGYWALASRNAENLSFYNMGLPGDVLTLYPSGSAAFPAGNVGIGTTTPGQALELVRDNANVAMRFHDPGDAWYSVGIRRDQGLTFQINYGPDPGSSPGFAIATNGNVGIGTPSPTAKLTVAGEVRVGNRTVIDQNGLWVGLPTNLQGPKGDKGNQGIKGDKGDQGIQGLKGDQGIAGPAVTTFAVCNDSVSSPSATCASMCAHVVGGTAATGGVCRVTADGTPGFCQASGCTVNCSPIRYALCCTCRP